MAYTPTFTRNPLGNFNDQKAYAGVIGGTNAYLMEDEINELQWIQNRNRTRMTAQLNSSGSFAKGTDSVASGVITMAARDLLVGGHYVRMEGKTADSANVKFTLPAGPGSGTRTDIVYLVLYLNPINYQSTLYKYGYLQGDTLTNDMNDVRAAGETTRRIQKQWTIAAVTGQSTMTGAGYTATAYDSNLYTKANASTVDGVEYAIPLYTVLRTFGSPDVITDTAYYVKNYSTIGQANGLATLDSGGHVPASQLVPANLPLATTTTVGAVKVSNGLQVDGAGTLSINTAVTATTGANTFTGLQTFSGAGSDIVAGTGNNSFHIRPLAGQKVGFSNAAASAWNLYVDDSTGGAYSRNNTIDDGTGQSSFYRNMTMDGKYTATASNDYWSPAVMFNSYHWNGSASVMYQGYMQTDNLGGFQFYSSGSGVNRNVLGFDNTGNITSPGYVKIPGGVGTSSPGLWFSSTATSGFAPGTNAGIFLDNAVSIALNAGPGGVYTMKNGVKSNTLDDGNGRAFFGDSTNGYLRLANDPTGFYLEAMNGAQNASKALILTGVNGAATTVKTFNNVLDDGSGYASFLGVVKYGPAAYQGQLSYGTGVVTLEAVSANTSIMLKPTGTGTLQLNPLLDTAVTTKRNVLDAGDGSATFAGVVNSGKTGSGTGGNFRSISDDGTSRWLSGILGTVGAKDYSIYNFVSGSTYLNISNTNGALTSKNNILDDGLGNAKLIGTLTSANNIELTTAYTASFANGTSNQKVDIILGNISYTGEIEVTLTANWANSNAQGVIRKVYAVGISTGGTIFTQATRYSEVQGNTAGSYALGDITWDATNTRFRIQVASLTSAGNPIVVHIRAIGINQTQINTLQSNLTFGAIYTTDTTVLPTANVNFHGKLTTDNNVLDDGSGVGLFGNATYGYLRLAQGSLGVYVQAVNAAQSGSTTLWLTGQGGAPTTVKTSNNTLDDSIGNATFAGNTLKLTGTNPIVRLTTTGINPPANIGTLSTGMKHLLWDDGSFAYGMGVEGNGIWASSIQYFKVYNYGGVGTAGTAPILAFQVSNKAVTTFNNTLDDGSGNVTVTGGLNLNKYGSSTLAGAIVGVSASGNYFTNSSINDLVIRGELNSSILFGFKGASGAEPWGLRIGYSAGTAGIYTHNNTLDDGSGNIVVKGYFAASSTNTNFHLAPAVGGNIGFSNNAASQWGLRVTDAASPATYTMNNTLDDGAGRATFANDVTINSNGSAANSWSYALWFKSVNAAGTGISSYIQTNPNGDIKITASGTNVLTASANKYVLTANNTLDDGSGNASLAGGLTFPVGKGVAFGGGAFIQNTGTQIAQIGATSGFYWANNANTTQTMTLSNTGDLTVSGNLGVNGIPTFSNGASYFTNTGNAGIRLYETNTAGNAKHLRVSGNQFNIVNGAYTQVIFQVDDSGNIVSPSAATFNYGGYVHPYLRTTNGYVEWYNSGTWQGVGGVKNVQRGTVNVPSAGVVNVTVTAVNMAKSFINFPNSVGGTSSAQEVTAVLTSSTNIQFYSLNNAFNNISWELVESY